jgi:pimeloyl-ACP methyl ester carboxylesterase
MTTQIGTAAATIKDDVDAGGSRLRRAPHLGLPRRRTQPHADAPADGMPPSAATPSPRSPVDWELCESGPTDAERTVLLLPGGMCSAGSYAEVMSQHALAQTRLVAATLPGQAGAPSPDDYSVENYARLVTELATKIGADAVVGFSMGADVAVEMVTSGCYTGPVVLLAVSLSPRDEPAFFRAIVRSTSVLGDLPMKVMKAGVGSMVKRIPVPAERQTQLREDFGRNRPRDMRLALQAYLLWLHGHEGRVERLCEAGVPMWIVHAEKKGDGGLTGDERRVLEGCPHARIVTIPGSVFFLPNEIPERIGDIIAEALAAVPS